ncbi:PRC-barrel domain-containing protein [bacterium]|nr:PRC-barrel domain-containing protein [bacterium]
MLTTREVRNVKVYMQPKKGKEFTKDGLPRRGKKIGKVFKTVFDPSGMRVVGFIVRRPDLLWMFKRPERFLAMDAMAIDDSGMVTATMGGASWDDRAIKRLGIDYDKCFVWEGMQVRTTAGEDLGRVDDISFDETTGEVNSFFLDDGGAARALIGSFEIGRDLVVGYRNDRLVVKKDASSSTRLTGGLAAKAGTATAKAQIAAHEGAEKAGKAAGKAVDAGAFGLGKAIGRIKTSVTGAVDGFKEEAALPEKKPAAKTAATKTAVKPAAKKTTSSTAKKTATTGTAATKKATTAKASATGAATKKATATKKAATGATASKPKAADATTKTTAKPKAAGATTKATTAKKSPTKAAAKPKTTAKKASSASASDTGSSAGAAIGEHLKGASTMFADFKREFDEARKDD